MNSPYQDYYLEIIPYYNEDGMTPFSYIIPKSMEYFTAKTNEENINTNNGTINIDMNNGIAISNESPQSFRTDWAFLQNQDYLKNAFNSIIDSEDFKQGYNKFIETTPFEDLFKKYVGDFPKESCSVNIFVNYSKKFFTEQITSSIKNTFITWWDANKSDSNNFILNITKNDKLHEPFEYFLNCFFLEDDTAKRVRKNLLCYIQNYISNNQCTDVLNYIKGFVNSLEYDSNGLKSLSTCNCDETINEETIKIASSLFETPQPVNTAESSSSSTIWITLAIVVVIIIIVVIVVIFMKKSKSNVSALYNTTAFAE